MASISKISPLIIVGVNRRAGYIYLFLASVALASGTWSTGFFHHNMHLATYAFLALGLLLTYLSNFQFSGSMRLVGKTLKVTVLFRKSTVQIDNLESVSCYITKYGIALTLVDKHTGKANLFLSRNDTADQRKILQKLYPYIVKVSKRKDKSIATTIRLHIRGLATIS